jgi:hypothetical protein
MVTVFELNNNNDNNKSEGFCIDDNQAIQDLAKRIKT